MKRTKAQNPEVIIHEPSPQADYFSHSEIARSLDHFKIRADLTGSNQTSPASPPRYTRDLYHRD